MPLPFFLGAAAVAAGAFGVKKGLKAKKDMNEAKELNEDAQDLAKSAEKRIDNARQNTAKQIENLGRTKISILSTSMKQFVKTFSRIKNVNFRDSMGYEELKDFTPGSLDFDNLEKASFKASDMASGGIGAIAAGSLLAAGTYGAVGTAALGAAASTGTAIAGLSGAAATNATLAWLGGGSLAAGGFGMAGGMVVLGGLVAGPALAIGGAFMASKAKEALYNAEENYDKALAFDEQSKNIASKLNAVSKRANQIQEILTKLDGYMGMANESMLEVILDSGSDWKNYSREQKETVGACAQLAKTIKLILDTSLLGENGELTRESKEAVNAGERALEEY